MVGPMHVHPDRST